MKCLFGCLAFAGSMIALAHTASGATIGATIVDASSGDYSLTSVSVTRGGAGTLTYEPFQLTGVALTDVDAFDIPLLVPRGGALPAAGSRAALLQDNRLDTGVINITTTNGTADRSVEVMFAAPIVNSAGEDILIFEAGGDDSIRWWIDNDRTNKSADLATAAYSGNLLTVPFSRYRYRNGADGNLLSLADLETAADRYAFADDNGGTINALGLDLSSVGVPLGGSVTSIRFQSLANGGGRIDPVLIVGLPAVPEPATAASLATLALAAARRRRR